MKIIIEVEIDGELPSGKRANEELTMNAVASWIRQNASFVHPVKIANSKTGFATFFVKYAAIKSPTSPNN